MTTYIQFLPSNTATPPFSATVTMDGNTYSLSVTWNIAGQRWYITISDQNGNVIWSGGMIGSPLTSDIILAPGVFQTSTILYREDTGMIEIAP